jgi:hypothetical protein
MNIPKYRLFTKLGNPLPNHPISKQFATYSLTINNQEEWHISGCPHNTKIINNNITLLPEEDAQKQWEDTNNRLGELQIFNNENTHTKDGLPILTKLTQPLKRYKQLSTPEQFKKETEYRWHSKSPQPKWVQAKQKYNKIHGHYNEQIPVNN